MELTWLGQAGFELAQSSGGPRLLVDPWFTDHELRLAPPPPTDRYRDVSWLFVTHEHGDHLDLEALPSLTEANPELQVVLPAPLAPMLDGIVPPADVHAVKPGDSVDAGGVHVTVLPAVHGVTVEDGYHHGLDADGVSRFVGYVLAFDDGAVYHAGDTIVAPELLDAVRATPADVCLLPVNGRDFFREQAGVLGNLHPREAVDLAVAASARVVVPMHHDLVRGNTDRAGALADAVAAAAVDLHVVNLARERPITLIFDGADRAPRPARRHT